ncbi:MAG: CoF synthetase [Paracoccaceae bacterium]
MSKTTETLGAFLASFLLPKLPRSVFEAWQRRALKRWLKRDVPKVAAYSHGPQSLDDMPIIEKSDLLDDFSGYNAQGFTKAQVHQAIDDNARIGTFIAGASSGTSGNRGLFVISDTERFRWLGSILAKTLPDLIWKRPRVAILLPQATPLYDSANEAGPLTLRVFDLKSGVEHWQGDLEQFNPTVLVAPPKILRYLAEMGVNLTPQRVFSASETLDPTDRIVIEEWSGSRLGQIYMASEGLLAVTCRQGRLHLAEDSIFFEFDTVGPGLVNPIITSFRRSTQILARYRMNDILRLSQTPCTCGSSLRVIDEVIGRMDDCLHLPKAGKTIVFTPDVLRNAVVSSSASINDFRIIQTDARTVCLKLPLSISLTAAQDARDALAQLIDQRTSEAVVQLVQEDLKWEADKKLRRIKSEFSYSPQDH